MNFADAMEGEHIQITDNRFTYHLWYELIRSRMQLAAILINDMTIRVGG